MKSWFKKKIVTRQPKLRHDNMKIMQWRILMSLDSLTFPPDSDPLHAGAGRDVPHLSNARPSPPFFTSEPVSEKVLAGSSSTKNFSEQVLRITRRASSRILALGTTVEVLILDRNDSSSPANSSLGRQPRGQQGRQTPNSSTNHWHFPQSLK
jgi:hypothetical protein